MVEKQRAAVDEEQEKRGVFTGRYCVNPFNGERVPIYVANFVLMDYGPAQSWLWVPTTARL